MSNDSNPPIEKQRSISANTRWVSTIGAKVLLISSIIYGTWTVSNYASEQKGQIARLSGEVSALRSELQVYSKEAWKFDEQNAFARTLRLANGTSLFVPEPRDFRR